MENTIKSWTLVARQPVQIEHLLARFPLKGTTAILCPAPLVFECSCWVAPGEFDLASSPQNEESFHDCSPISACIKLFFL